MGYSEYLATLIASVLVSGTLAIFFWRRHPAPGARFIAVLTGMTMIWSLGYIVEVMSRSLFGFQIANNIEYIGFVSVPVLWFIFSAKYIGYENWLTRRWYFLFIIPALTLILVWTNDLHGWMWNNARLETFGEFLVQVKNYGPWFWVHSIYSYFLMLAGVGIIATRLFHPQHLYRNQVIILLIAIILPMIWNVIYILKAPPTYQIDMTPIAFVVSGIIIAFGLFRFNILKIVPIARNTVVENMDDGVIVLDRQNQILDLNRAAERIIGHSASDVIGKPAGLILAKLSDWQKHISDNGRLQTEIIIEGMEKRRYYELYLIPMYDSNKNLTARIMTLHDITERKNMEQSLKAYAKRITQVQEEERKRIAYELHDDTAQYLSILKLQLDSLIQSGKIQDPEVVEKLEFLEKDAGRAVDDVRRYSHELRPGILDYLGLRAALEQLAEDINKLKQVNVDFKAEGEEPELSGDVKLGLFRIAQEALSNARKYSGSKQVSVSLSFKDNRLKLTVRDDGAGFDVNGATARSSQKGSLGLMSMQERATLIGADLNIKSEPGKGTTVSAEVSL